MPAPLRNGHSIIRADFSEQARKLPERRPRIRMAGACSDAGADPWLAIGNAKELIL
jgi:hypothetical protein